MNAVVFNRAAAAAGILAFAFAVLVGGVSQSTADAPTQTECSEAWDESPAADYCSNTTISVAEEECDVTASCSVEVTLNFTNGATDSKIYTPSVDLATSLGKVDDIDICFYTNPSGKWVAYTRVGCHSTETAASQAVANGLSADAAAEDES